ncbi:MAG: FadR family transcriptional regulator [Desulfovibrio sp.]|nr:MAG: FadR family transcriptional regulator [Desulfovibrio sp.]
MTLTAIESKRLYQQVAEQLAAHIREGLWKEGERLPAERDLAQQLGVSRPSVREAMIALELKGVVEVRMGAGIYVRGAFPETGVTLVPPDEDPGPSPFDLMAARRLIEGETASIAAGTIDEQGLAGLMAAISHMEKDMELGVQNVTNSEDGDQLFHRRIAECTNNMVLVSIVDQLWEGMRRPMFQTIADLLALPGNARRAVADHRMIVERIAARDPEGARRTMHAHLDQVSSWLMKDGVGGNGADDPDPPGGET